MPTLLSPEYSGTASQRADREAELASDAARLGHSLAVGDAPTTANPKGPAQTAFDTELADGGAVFQEMPDSVVADHVRYMERMGVPRERILKALRLDGLTMPPDLPDPDLAALHSDIGVPIDPKPADYANVDLGKLALDLPADRLGNVQSVAKQWAADLRLDPALGAGVIEHLASVGGFLAKQTPDEQSKWIDNQNSRLIKLAGSKAAAEAMREKATKVLSLSQNIVGALGTENLSASIKNSAIMNSAFLISTLANQADAIAALEREKKKL